MSVAFDVEAGKRYGRVGPLQVAANENAGADFYGTASLERILVTPGMETWPSAQARLCLRCQACCHVHCHRRL